MEISEIDRQLAELRALRDKLVSDRYDVLCGQWNAVKAEFALRNEVADVIDLQGWYEQLPEQDRMIWDARGEGEDFAARRIEVETTV